MSRRYTHGLSARQKLRVNEALEEVRKVMHHGARVAGDTPLEGWSLFRAPTTINPPTTLRLHYRDRNGKLQQVISITENGVTKMGDVHGPDQSRE